MDLSRMQDIGGVRAVLDIQEQVQRVLERFCRNSLRRNSQPDKIKDYVASPQPSGYRAIHIHTTYHDRRIEVQLRTRGQHSWARIVDYLTSTTNIDFKNGDGPGEVHELLRQLSEILAMRESGQPHTEIPEEILTPLAMMAAFGKILRS
jgi:ppGpp synthetase/RelA/SpoT-type nucleotidyltranferase